MMTLDIIGALFDGETQLPGFHVNTVASEMTAELEAYRVSPSHLRRVWSGDDPNNPVWTVALRFDDETTAKTILGNLGNLSIENSEFGNT